MGLFSSVGSILNSITGATSAAKQNQKYALQSAQINNNYQKEFAQNAHQWEMNDLKKAGINPIITGMGGSGASASGGGVNSAQMQSSGINPLDTIINTVNGIQSAKKTGAETANVQANTLNTQIDTIGKGIMNKIAEIDLGYKSKINEAELNKKKQELKNMQAQYDKLVEETNKLKGGRVSATLGTWVNNIFNDDDNKPRNKGKDPNKPNLFSNRNGEQPIRFW